MSLVRNTETRQWRSRLNGAGAKEVEHFAMPRIATGARDSRNDARARSAKLSAVLIDEHFVFGDRGDRKDLLRAIPQCRLVVRQSVHLILREPEELTIRCEAGSIDPVGAQRAGIADSRIKHRKSVDIASRGGKLGKSSHIDGCGHLWIGVHERTRSQDGNALAQPICRDDNIDGLRQTIHNICCRLEALSRHRQAATLRHTGQSECSVLIRVCGIWCACSAHLGAADPETALQSNDPRYVAGL